jgi:hypothetical protein
MSCVIRTAGRSRRGTARRRPWLADPRLFDAKTRKALRFSALRRYAAEPGE